MDAKQVVLGFWKAMQSNDFKAASHWLSSNYVCTWPQSNEVIRGPNNFVAINEYYPADGLWQFELNDIVAEGDKVVTDVMITDGKLKARAITFHTVANDKIVAQNEFWPDDYEAPQWRAQWVEIKGS